MKGKEIDMNANLYYLILQEILLNLDNGIVIGALIGTLTYPFVSFWGINIRQKFAAFSIAMLMSIIIRVICMVVVVMLNGSLEPRVIIGLAGTYLFWTASKNLGQGEDPMEQHHFDADQRVNSFKEVISWLFGISILFSIDSVLVANSIAMIEASTFIDAWTHENLPVQLIGIGAGVAVIFLVALFVARITHPSIKTVGHLMLLFIAVTMFLETFEIHYDEYIMLISQLSIIPVVFFIDWIRTLNYIIHPLESAIRFAREVLGDLAELGNKINIVIKWPFQYLFEVLFKGKKIVIISKKPSKGE